MLHDSGHIFQKIWEPFMSYIGLDVAAIFLQEGSCRVNPAL